ncbi:MAG TPA: biopolymer transporter ExbD, partial [Candidatus Krumholzibacteria bacterium]
MLVTPLLQKGMGVTLPAARNVQAVSENEEEIVVVALTAGGQVFIGKDAVAKDRVGARLKQRLRSNAAVQMQIRADRSARFKDVRDLVRAGREAGFSGVALIADEIKDHEGAAAGASGAPGED